MITFHYIISDVIKKEKYHVKKLIFIDEILEKSEDIYMNNNQIKTLKYSISETKYTIINDSKVDLDTFLRNITLIKK